MSATDATDSLARFARRVADADRAPAGPTAERVRRLFLRAALVRQWPALRAAFAGCPPANDPLPTAARLLADECRKKPSGLKVGWPKELLDDAAKRLEQLADRLDAPPPPAGPLAALDATLTGWEHADPLAASLVKLETELAARTDAARGLLDWLSENPPGHAARHFDAKLPPAAGWTPDARAAAVAVCELADRLTALTSDPPLWEWVGRWADGWFEAAGVQGGLRFGELDAPGAVIESFPLATGRRVYLAVAGGGASEPPPDQPAEEPRADAASAEDGGAEAPADAPPLPPGLAELQRAAEKLPATELKAMVASLRAAAEGDYLREAVLQLHTDYHGDAGDAARAADARAAAEVGERLEGLLRDGFDLTPFRPANLHDLPGGWVSVAPGSRVVTGVVRRVLRPGLQDGGGNLRIPAVAEVE